LRDLLAPGGVFLAVEPAPNPLWDLVFGRYAGWWQSGENAAGGSPLRSAAGWTNDLAVAGFADVGSAPLLAGPWPSAVFWGRGDNLRDELPSPNAATRTIGLIGSGTGAAAEFRDGLASAGHQVREVDAPAFGTAEDADSSVTAVLFVVEPGGDPTERTARLIARFAKAAAAAAQRQVPVWLVTTGAQCGVDAAEAGLVGGALWGFGRVLMNEMPRLSLRLVDLAPAMIPAARAAALAEELAADCAETEIVWTEAGRHVLRLRRGLPPRWAEAADSLALTAASQGGLDGLGWQPIEPRQPGAGEVLIDVHAAGLNFRDMMWGMGLLPEEALIDGFAGATFGLECAGIVRAVGAGGLDGCGAGPGESLEKRLVLVAVDVVFRPPRHHDLLFAKVDRARLSRQREPLTSAVGELGGADGVDALLRFLQPFARRLARVAVGAMLEQGFP